MGNTFCMYALCVCLFRVILEFLPGQGFAELSRGLLCVGLVWGFLFVCCCVFFLKKQTKTLVSAFLLFINKVIL